MLVFNEFERSFTRRLGAWKATTAEVAVVSRLKHLIRRVHVTDLNGRFSFSVFDDNVPLLVHKRLRL